MHIHLLNTEPMVGRILSQFMLRIGHEVSSASLYNLDAPPGPGFDVDLIISELSRLHPNPLGVLGRLHREHPQSLIVVITEGSPAFTSEQAQENGIYAFWRKPIYFSEIELLLQRIVEHKQMERTLSEHSVQNSGQEEIGVQPGRRPPGEEV